MTWDFHGGCQMFDEFFFVIGLRAQLVIYMDSEQWITQAVYQMQQTETIRSP
jgi:hypothetical protein